MWVLASESATSGPVFTFLVLFAVILLGPIVVERLGLPGLIGLVVGGFVIGAHGLNLIHAGNETVPELGQLGLLYLMFVAGLELDLQILKDYRRAAVGLGLLAFAIPGALGLCVGLILGWSTPAMCLLGALLASHTLIVYPRLREAGLAGHPAVATAVGATVLTDTLALIVLAVVAGSQTDSGSPAYILGEITVGFAVLIGVGLLALPRVVDAGLRRWGSDGVTRFLLMIVALLLMAMLAQVFGIEGIVGAFFAGLGLNVLWPNEGPSMERVEFFGTAIFVPVFTVPQAAATLAVTLIGFEIGLFGVTVVNAVLVLILVSIFASAVLTEKVIAWMPPREQATRRLGATVLVITPANGPSDAAVRAATLLARPDGGHSELLIARTATEPAPELRAIEKRICRHGFEGHARTEITDVPQAVMRAQLADEHSLVVVDDPVLDTTPGPIPLLVVDADDARPPRTLVADGAADLAAEITQRLARDKHWRRSLQTEPPVTIAT